MNSKIIIIFVLITNILPKICVKFCFLNKSNFFLYIKYILDSYNMQTYFDSNLYLTIAYS